MHRKKIMLLGGNYMQMTATLAAKEQGYYVISVDYLPENPAHTVADEYHNISTIDKEKVLALAKEKQIDGIVSYASDVSAPTAAYVAEALGLPTNPYESVMIMTHKDRFRAFLKENGFPMPEGSAFTDYEAAFAFFKRLPKPVMVKPIDASGSKGVNKISSDADFPAAWEEARSYSLSKTVIVEQFIQRHGYQIDGDAFVIDGKLAFWGICDQHHDAQCSLYAPTGHSFPPTQAENYQMEARAQIERLLSLLHMHMGAYNVEYIVGDNGQVYLMEIGPRNGGNWITDAIRSASGVDLAAYTVRQAVGDSCDTLLQKQAVLNALAADPAAPRVYSSSYIVHSRRDGIFRDLIIAPEVRKHLVKQYITARPGDEIKRFRNGGCGIGAMIFNFENADEMCKMIDSMCDYVQVVVE